MQTLSHRATLRTVPRECGDRMCDEPRPVAPWSSRLVVIIAGSIVIAILCAVLP